MSLTKGSLPEDIDVTPEGLAGLGDSPVSWEDFVQNYNPSEVYGSGGDVTGQTEHDCHLINGEDGCDHPSHKGD